jgi:hypothetical protein
VLQSTCCKSWKVEVSNHLDRKASPRRGGSIDDQGTLVISDEDASLSRESRSKLGKVRVKEMRFSKSQRTYYTADIVFRRIEGRKFYQKLTHHSFKTALQQGTFLYSDLGEAQVRTGEKWKKKPLDLNFAKSFTVGKR